MGVSNNKIIASGEEIGMGLADREAVGIGPDIIKDGVEISLVGYYLTIESILKYMVPTHCFIDGIFESCDKEAQMLGEPGLYPKQYVHMIGHHYILLCP